MSVEPSPIAATAALRYAAGGLCASVLCNCDGSASSCAMPRRPRSNRSFVQTFGLGISLARRDRRSKLGRSYWNRSCLSTFTMWIRGPWVIRPRTRFNSQISVPGFQGDRNVEGRCEVKTARNVVTFWVCFIQICVASGQIAYRLPEASLRAPGAILSPLLCFGASDSPPSPAEAGEQAGQQ